MRARAGWTSPLVVIRAQLLDVVKTYAARLAYPHRRTNETPSGGDMPTRHPGRHAPKDWILLDDAAELSGYARETLRTMRYHGVDPAPPITTWRGRLGVVRSEFIQWLDEYDRLAS